MIDLLIIGAGPIGLACGISAVKNKLSHVIIDRGCLVNSIYNYPSNMTFFSTSDRLEIGGVPFISSNPKPTRPEALEYYRRVTSSWALNVRLYESIQKITKTDQVFQVKSSKGDYQARNIILATGFYDLPFLLNVPGEDLPKVIHYYKDPHPFYAMKVAVVGAANSAVDAALEIYRKGASTVTMIIREKEIGENVKYWVRPDIINRIKEGSIKAYFESQITAIQQETIEVKTPKGKKVLENDFVLAMTGYQPDFKFLEMIGIHIGNDPDKTPIYNPETMETNVPGLFLAGVICGGLKTNKWFIENSREHADRITSFIKSRRQ
jgi:thioredoxin reductase (NADPH)